MSVLDRVLARVSDASSRGTTAPLAVFDLDSTLFSTQERNHAILTEFAAVRPAIARVLERLGPSDMGWNVMDDLRQRGFDDEGTLTELRAFWLERFFADDYLRFDLPLPGSSAYVCDLYAAGAHIIYVTGRDEPKMGRGTRDSLRAHGFPLGVPRTGLRLKPRFEDSDLEFKRSVLGELKDAGSVVAIFENEPANANLFAEAFPECEVVFLETVHAPDPPPLVARAVRLKDFRR